MAFYALDTILHQGREYPAGEKLPVEDDTGKALVERGLATTTKPSDEFAEAANSDTPPDYSKLNKGELEALAEQRGVGYEDGATVKDLRAALEADDEAAPPA